MLGGACHPSVAVAARFLPKLGREISHGLFLGCPQAGAWGRQVAQLVPLSLCCKKIATAFTMIPKLTQDHAV